MIDDLKPGEAMLMGSTRCGTCCHLIGLHIEVEGEDLCCIVEDCGCTLQPLGPITLSAPTPSSSSRAVVS